MSQKAIREFDGKAILSRELSTYPDIHFRGHTFFQVSPTTDIDEELKRPENQWLKSTPLVVKPDQLIKRRGKAGLIGLNLSLAQAKEWLAKHRNQPVTIGSVTGILDTFIIEPYVAHPSEDEYYVCIYTSREYDEIIFTHKGGVDVGDIDATGLRLQVPLNGLECPSSETVSTSSTPTLPADTKAQQQKNDIFGKKIITEKLLINIPKERKERVATFILRLLQTFQNLHFSYLEINPIVFTETGIAVLDLAAKLDETASFEVGQRWGAISFPSNFGRSLLPEEEFIRDLDSKTGASLKLTVLNPKGKVWLMVAGGGASVIHADSVCDAGYAHELANYGEYSGAPTEGQTYLYARTILSLMTKVHDENEQTTDTADSHSQLKINTNVKPLKNKILLVGGGIANFTDIAATFKGLIKALTEFSATLLQQKISIWVRRAGPNWQEGLDLMRSVGARLGLDMHVFGPETHMTAIIPLSLGLSFDVSQPQNIPEVPQSTQRKIGSSATTAVVSAKSGPKTDSSSPSATTPPVSSPSEPPSPTKFVVQSLVDSNDALVARRLDHDEAENEAKSADPVGAHGHSETQCSTNNPPICDKPLFTPDTKAIVYGLQLGAIQNMLDFDILSRRERPSVVCIVYPFLPNHYQKFYWNSTEMLIPCVTELSEATSRFPEADVLVSFASFRSVYESTVEALELQRFRTVAIIAEGVPERRSRQLLEKSKKYSPPVTIIGPATVGGLKPGCFRIGNAGGMLDNIVASRLYRPGSVAYVTRSGGMSNELNNILSLNSDGVYEGIAIGGDMYPGSSFIDHLLRYEADPNVKMIVVLGEVGGLEEYKICELLTQGKIKKPLIAWCIGTCSQAFPYEVQFGHAGACATGPESTAGAKNRALEKAGARVPVSFDTFGQLINRVYNELLAKKVLSMKVEPLPPVVPVDYSWARKLGLVRKPSAFISSISDERGDELKYAGVPISTVLDEGLGVGGTLGLLWFRRKLPKFFITFIEMVLVLTADHGPAVSGAHNTIVAARAGKDLVSSLCSGLLTVGPRFGGALDDAAREFTQAFDKGLQPQEFVDLMRQKKQLIPGIGHKVKSLEDPDARVKAIKAFMAFHLPHAPIFEFACKVEQLTTKKKSNLILNVDGAVAVAFVDLMRLCGSFSSQEAKDFVDLGVLNGLFVLGRSIGFIGHWIDQNRLKQPLYRHPTDDISYITDH